MALKLALIYESDMLINNQCSETTILQKWNQNVSTSKMDLFFTIVKSQSLTIVKVNFVLDAVGVLDWSLTMSIHLGRISYEYDVRLKIFQQDATVRKRRDLVMI